MFTVHFTAFAQTTHVSYVSTATQFDFSVAKQLTAWSTLQLASRIFCHKQAALNGR